jgi:2-polyprenyl-3-methyl-5-hydroxy-6-metoxy-1,4-benzoquinol methylase
MNTGERKDHWERIFQTKDLKDVSWYQEVPSASLDFIKSLKIPKSARIIDVGAGDSLLVDHLLANGYQDITVLDISENAITRAKARLGEKANQVKWIVADAVTFRPEEKYDFWHDRAAFHFLTKREDIENYIAGIRNCIRPDGYLMLATFSEAGPEKCSGIEVKQYSEKSMITALQEYFRKIKCIVVDHPTPAGKLQNFLYCSFHRLNVA